MRRTHRLGRILGALAVIAAGATDARAALITYATDLQVGGMSVPSVSTTIMPPDLGSASLTVTPVSGVGPLDIGGVPTAIPFGTQTVDTSAFAVLMPFESETIGVGPFSLFLTLTDVATNESGTLQFTAAVGGSVHTPIPNGMFTRISTSYTPLIGLVGQTRTVQVGDSAYDVTLIFNGLSLLSNQLVDSSSFQVEVVQAVPEPASLTLLGVGLLASIWRARARRGRD